MIDRKKAKKGGVRIIDSGSKIAQDKAVLQEKLRALLPNLVNSDGQVDVKALHNALSPGETTGNNQGYELTFAGKGLARHEATTPTDMELQTVAKQSKDFENTGNVIIRGDNIDALKILYQNYYGKIRMIYIDPPYNTQTENFVYKDNFRQNDSELIERLGMDEETIDFLHNVYGTRSHSGWLAFMYPRLKLARELLTEDGVLFISTDDNEMANLRIICDEIFGENRFVGNIIWESKTKAQNTETAFDKLQPKMEYILCYALGEKTRFKLRRTGNKIYTERDDRGEFRYAPIEQMGSQGMRSRESMKFPILGVTPDKDKQWKIGKDKIKIYKERGDLLLRNGKPCVKMRPDDERNEKAAPFWAFFSKELGTAEGAKTYLSEILKRKDHGFDSVKPIEIVKELLFHATGSQDIVLDFFAGTGTTADAVMQINAEDEGRRKFILVQSDEKAAFISKICIERVNRAGEKVKKETEKKNGRLLGDLPPLDTGYKVFTLVPKPRVEAAKKGGKQTLSAVNKRYDIKDTLYNMLAATCKPLDTKIDCLIRNKLYEADGELYLLANIPPKNLEKYRGRKINLDGWADISLEQYLNLGVADKRNKDITVIY